MDRGVPQEASGGRGGLMTAEPVIEQVHPDRVRLVFEQADGAVKETRAVE